MNAMDIIHALWDKDEHGDNLTVIQFTLERMDEQTGETIQQISELTTRDPLVSLADIGGYTTIRITYKYNNASDFNRMRIITEDYSQLMTEFIHADGSGEGKEEGVPCLRIVVKPMSIKGAMIAAANPIFHNIQPHDPMYTECNEMQLLFLPDSVGFYEAPDFDEEAISDQVRAELTAEQAAEQNAKKKKEEREAYQKEREKEMEKTLSDGYDMHGGRAIQQAYHGFGKDRDKE
ncbi:MAG: hypothetical protein NC489_46985 [Ruminococcus flavefaciens]|nr:hypothetical protein [Ruminococcus flavefaciens]